MRISLPVVTSKSYQVSLLDIDFQIVSALVNFQTVILRHSPTSSSPLECCCQFDYQELSSPTTNSEITKKGEGSNMKREVCVCPKITKIWLLYKMTTGESKSHSLQGLDYYPVWHTTLRMNSAHAQGTNCCPPPVKLDP